MCLIVFSYKSHSKYPLLLATNRDEYYKRPTEPAYIWNNSVSFIAGKDLEGNGTWMGCTLKGRFALLTNFRSDDKVIKDAPSRGQIVLSFLKSGLIPQKFLHNLKEHAEDYNGFNLIAGTINHLYYFNNQNFNIEKVKPGIHALSNAYLNTEWPKTKLAEKEFHTITEATEPSEKHLIRLLQNTTTFPDELLPATGLSKKMEQAVSAIFIKTKDYGTRSSTIFKISKEGEITFFEKCYKPGTLKTEYESRHIIKPPNGSYLNSV